MYICQFWVRCSPNKCFQPNAPCKKLSKKCFPKQNAPKKNALLKKCSPGKNAPLKKMLPIKKLSIKMLPEKKC